MTGVFVSKKMAHYMSTRSVMVQTDAVSQSQQQDCMVKKHHCYSLGKQFAISGFDEGYINIYIKKLFIFPEFQNASAHKCITNGSTTYGTIVPSVHKLRGRTLFLT